MNDRDTFILSFLHYSYALAHRRKHLAEFDDIVQECMLEATLLADYALTLEHPHSYVNKALIGVANTYVTQNRLIKKPRKVERGYEIGYEYQPITDELLESLIYTAPSGTDDYTDLYGYIKQLTEKQQIAIMNLYGLEGCGYSSPSELARRYKKSPQTFVGNRKYALKELRNLLAQHSGRTYGK